MTSNFYIYPGECRAMYLNGISMKLPKNSGKHFQKLYLNPAVNSKIYTGYYIENNQNNNKPVVKFAKELYNYFFSKLPKFKDVLLINQLGVYITQDSILKCKNGKVLAHVFLGVMKKYEKNVGKYGFPSTWSWDTFFEVLASCNQDSGLQHRKNGLIVRQNTASIAKLLTVVHEVPTKYDNLALLDSVIPSNNKEIKITIPDGIKLIDSDKRYFEMYNLKPVADRKIKKMFVLK